jgi:tetratricopeptide (TPR) repeat protein
MTRIFLARTEEQKRFREVLRSLQPNAVSRLFSQNFPTAAKLLSAKKEAVSSSPHIFFLYGEGGMGKTSLGRRFCDLTREEFPDRFQVLRLDWEEEKDNYPSLNVGHESIRPESVLETIYHLMVSEGHKGAFNEYRQVEKTLKEIENKVDKALQAPQGNSPLARIGKMALGLLLAKLQMDYKVEELLGVKDSKKTEELTNLVADESINALAGLMKKHLDLKERRIFAKPHQQLAEALGHGLQAISAQKPLVLLLDTYEIVDRLECDRVLRMVIKAAGRRVVWAIAGRANLADSYRLSQDYFRGYRDEFSENLYVYPMSEFSREQVSEYFAHPEIDVPLSDDAAESVKQFSFGIPFVVQQIAAMCQQGIELATILSAPSADRDDESPREAVVRATSDRFLRYCLDEHDQKAVYAMAMMRRPDNELLKAMLGVTDLEPEMRSLKARHSFVLLEGKGIRLYDKLESFLQDYLRSGLVGQSPMVRELSDRAVAYLEPRLGEWTQEFTDTADYFESDRIANGLLDLVQFKFWKDVEVGWRYAVPLFVESWQYNRDWQKQLLGIIEAFQVRFDGDSKKRLRIFTKDLGYYSFDTDGWKELLDELEKLAKRGWLDGERKTVRMAILFLQHGRLLYELERYSECLRIYLEAEKLLPETALHLRKDLAENLEMIGGRLLWKEGYAIKSHEAKIAYQKAVKLNCKNSYAWNGLGNISHEFGNHKLAIKSFQKVIELDPKAAHAYNSLGNVYTTLKNYKLAVQSFEKALSLDPLDIYPYNGLGIVYFVLGNYKSAIKSFQKVIEDIPTNAFTYNNLGNIYKSQGSYELAKQSFHEAININSNLSYPYNGLGYTYLCQDNYDLAITSFQESIKRDPKFAYPRIYLGFVMGLQGNQDKAVMLWKQGLELFTGNSQLNHLLQVLLEIGMGDIEQGIKRLQNILETENPPLGFLLSTFQDAELMAQFPTKPEGIDTVIEMLRQAIEKAQ